MIDEKRAREDWEEDVFTINLEKFLRRIAHEHPLNLRVKSWGHVVTPEMLLGEASPKEAKIIDIQVWGHWHQHDNVYFAWECKLLADQSNRERKDLVNEYLKNGIFRFLDGLYSAHMSDAGMLGYVLAGDIATIVEQINRSMVSTRRHRKLLPSDSLTVDKPIGTFKDVYSSSHTRTTDGSRIDLRHLFLTFFSES